MATAIKGCIILEEDEKRGRMTYERVCEACGYHFDKVHTGLVAQHGVQVPEVRTQSAD